MTTDNLDVFGEDEVKADPMPGLVEPTEEQKEAQEAFEPAVDVETNVESDDDYETEKMYVIEVDEVEGRPNFEVVGVNGKVYRIQRGVPATVPGSVLHVLNNAVAERIVQTHNPQGGVNTRRQKYSSVPFRVLKAL